MSAEFKTVLGQMLRAGRRERLEISRETLAGTSPYRTIHYNRFGNYTIEVSRAAEPLSYKTRIL